MIFKALACDYDGTLASENRLAPATIAALKEARETGIHLILVTGRSFFELTRVCERLDLFEAVVAENGGVIYFPGAGVIKSQAPPPPERLLAELDRRDIYYEVGRVIVGTARNDEQAVREALAATGVSLDLVYNRSALMLIPAGVSKGTGVRQVIGILGLSFHDVMALGDAENDLDLFEACGFCACPENAVPQLKERADWVFPGEDGAGVASVITGPILEGFLPVDRSPRHRITIGWAVESSEPVTIPERGVNMLIHGDPLSGKSWLAGALVERLHGRRYAVLVIDPEGDYRVLRRLPGLAWMEIHDRSSMERALGHFDRDPSAAVVADLSALTHPEKIEMIETGFGLIRRGRRRSGRPHWVFLDEAHYSLHQGGVSDDVVAFEEKGFCLATYRSSWLRESVRKAMDILILARTTIPEELLFLRTLLGEPTPDGAGVISILPDLPRQEFVVMEPHGSGPRRALTFAATPRETPHVRHLTKYADSRVPSGQQFLFRGPDGRSVLAAASLNEFRRAVATVDDEVLAYHAERGDFSRWVSDVFSDRELARELRKTEKRWSRREIHDLRGGIELLIQLRYGSDLWGREQTTS